MDAFTVISALVASYFILRAVHSYKQYRRAKTEEAEAEARAKREARPPAPCGDDETHYQWTEQLNWPCPICAAQAGIAARRIERQKLAEAVAKEVVTRLHAEATVTVSESTVDRDQP